ncbi:diguanylate cyclase [Zobellella maritima]|uniref:diguanylate cyclase n=1 Tax=Zobellella maritima TaxID=2059725 RepID=UPI000E306F89|nr:diguanylate cyclase [Zobellella maritima]
MAENEQQRQALARLQALREDYLARLPKELAELRCLAARLPQAPQIADTLGRLLHRLHKLAGSGGSFGLPELSHHARRLERQIQLWLDSPLPNQAELAAFAGEIGTLAELGRPRCRSGAAWVGLSHPLPRQERVHLWLVEDDPQLAATLVEQLASFGYRVTRFCWLAEADQACIHDIPDILLLDMILEADGVHGTKQPLTRLAALACPLIIISERNDFQSRVRAAKLGAEGYILKPIAMPRLVNRISRILENRASPPERVLIVEDDQLLADHYRLVLEHAGMTVDILQQPELVAETVFSFRPELILMDLYMPDYSGPELAGVLRQHDNWTGLPIVYLSAETDLGRQIKALQSGADDFLTKPISDAQLVAAVRVRVKRARVLMSQINQDSLTGLLKHATIKEAVDMALANAHRDGYPITLAMLDIDFFKHVNDSYGHATGDVVISAVAMLLRQRLRRTDIIGRYGGEEFLAVLPGCDAASAHRIMDKIRQDFAQLPFSQGDTGFTCTLSVGLACTVSFPADIGAKLLAHADRALYMAKHGGRNQTRIAAPHDPPGPEHSA